MSASNYLEQAILDHIFNEAAFTAPTWYVALSTADPGEAGASIAEPVAMAYARKAVGATTRTASSVANDAEIAFTAASGAWGAITHFALFDALTEGNFLGSAALASPKTVGSGDVVKFAIGALTFTMD